MELTQNEILVLIDYYDNLKYELEDRIENFEESCSEILDSDLFNTQIKRFKNEKNGAQSRIKELRNELNNL